MWLKLEKQHCKRLTVLHLLTNKVTVFIHLDFIAAVMFKGFFRKHIVRHEIIPIPCSGISSGSDIILDLLSGLLARPEWKSNNLNIVLSGHFTQFRISKWNDALSKVERIALVKHQIEEIFNNKFDVFLSEDCFAKNTLAVAINHELYCGLVEIEKKLKLRIQSITPYFAVISNFWRHSIESNSFLIFIDASFAYIASTTNNSWDMFRLIPIHENWKNEIKRMLKQEALLNGDSLKQVVCYFYDEQSSRYDTNELKGYFKSTVLLKSFEANKLGKDFNYIRYLA